MCIVVRARTSLDVASAGHPQAGRTPPLFNCVIDIAIVPGDGAAGVGVAKVSRGESVVACTNRLADNQSPAAAAAP